MFVEKGRDILSICHAFNAVTVDGAFGLVTRSGSSRFDDVAVKSNDPALSDLSPATASTDENLSSADASSFETTTTMTAAMTAEPTNTLISDPSLDDPQPLLDSGWESITGWIIPASGPRPLSPDLGPIIPAASLTTPDRDASQTTIRTPAVVPAGPAWDFAPATSTE